MTSTEEREMHALAEILAALTENTGWEASRYAAIGTIMEKLAAYCAVSCTVCKKASVAPRLV